MGTLLADYVVDGELPEDLAGIRSNASEYPPSMAVLLNPFVLRAVVGLDRFDVLLNGSRSPARRRPMRRRGAATRLVDA